MTAKRTPGIKSRRRIEQNFKVTNLYSWDRLQNYNDDSCLLVALTPRQIAFLALSMQPGHWSTRWRLVNDINQPDHRFKAIIKQWVIQTETCLYMGCKVEDLIKTNLMLVAAVTGERIDLDAPLPTGTISYTGLTPQFRTTESTPRRIADVTAAGVKEQHTDLEAIKTAIGKLEDALETINTTLSEMELSPEDLEDDLARVWQLIETGVTLLGGAGVIPPVLPPL